MLSFSEFLRTNGNQSQPKIDWIARKDEWKKEVIKFNENIQKWLDTAIEDGKITPYITPLFVEEPFPVNSYYIPNLRLQIGKSYYDFKPIGTMISNCLGRIDLMGHEKKVIIILSNDKKWHYYDIEIDRWETFTINLKKTKTKPFTKSNLEKLLIKLSNNND